MKTARMVVDYCCVLNEKERVKTVKVAGEGSGGEVALADTRQSRTVEEDTVKKLANLRPSTAKTHECDEDVAQIARPTTAAKQDKELESIVINDELVGVRFRLYRLCCQV